MGVMENEETRPGHHRRHADESASEGAVMTGDGVDSDAGVLCPPWDASQVAALNEWQRSGFVHPFTCPNRDDGHHVEQFGDVGVLVATRDGWCCPSCSYTQQWAHRVMLETPCDPFGRPGSPL